MVPTEGPHLSATAGVSFSVVRVLVSLPSTFAPARSADRLDTLGTEPLSGRAQWGCPRYG